MAPRRFSRPARGGAPLVVSELRVAGLYHSSATGQTRPRLRAAPAAANHQVLVETQHHLVHVPPAAVLQVRLVEHDFRNIKVKRL
jgi:hypothetical protein